MDRHHITNYVIGGAALVLAGGALVYASKNTGKLTDQVDQITAAAHTGVALPVPRNSWPALGQAKTIALADALKKLPTPKMVNIWCPDLSCRALAADIDDAFQIAGWKDDDQPERIESNDEIGIAVGPPGTEALKLSYALGEVINFDHTPTRIVDMPPGSPLSVIIGKLPK